VLAIVLGAVAAIELPRFRGGAAATPTSSSTATPAALASRVTGTWRGDITQSDGRHWAMELHVDEGARTATTTYPELRCVGDATLVDTGQESLRYREHIRSGTCTADGTFTVSPQPSGGLYLYYVPEVGAYTASANLTRAG
jgi:hypothetical protein